jgi:hypothetical protein
MRTYQQLELSHADVNAGGGLLKFEKRGSLSLVFVERTLASEADGRAKDAEDWPMGFVQ